MSDLPQVSSNRADWIRRESISKPGKLYYFNTKTGGSIWAGTENSPELYSAPSSEPQDFINIDSPHLPMRTEPISSSSQNPASNSEFDRTSIKNKEKDKRRLIDEIVKMGKGMKRPAESRDQPSCSRSQKRSYTEANSEPTDVKAKNTASNRLKKLQTQLAKEVQEEQNRSKAKKRRLCSTETKTEIKSKRCKESLSPSPLSSSACAKYKKTNHNLKIPEPKTPKKERKENSEIISGNIISERELLPASPQFLKANKILYGITARLKPKYEPDNHTIDVYEIVSNGITKQYLQYSDANHPATPTQFIQATNILASINSIIDNRTNPDELLTSPTCTDTNIDYSLDSCIDNHLTNFFPETSPEINSNSNLVAEFFKSANERLSSSYVSSSIVRSENDSIKDRNSIGNQNDNYQFKLDNDSFRELDSSSFHKKSIQYNRLESKFQVESVKLRNQINFGDSSNCISNASVPKYRPPAPVGYKSASDRLRAFRQSLTPNEEDDKYGATTEIIQAPPGYRSAARSLTIDAMDIDSVREEWKPGEASRCTPDAATAGLPTRDEPAPASATLIPTTPCSPSPDSSSAHTVCLFPVTPPSADQFTAEPISATRRLFASIVAERERARAPKSHKSSKPEVERIDILTRFASGAGAGSCSGSGSAGRDRAPAELLLVVDTNIFVHHLHFLRRALDSSIAGYQEEAQLLVPWRVVNELDGLKDAADARLARKARDAMEYLYHALPAKNRVRGQSLRDANSHLFPCDTPDDEILNCCLQEVEKGNKIILVSNDKNLCNKATINRIAAMGVVELRTLLRADPASDLHHYEQCMHHLLSTILQEEMKSRYNDLWQRVMFKPPPWTLLQVIECLMKHWIAVFSQVFPRIQHLFSNLKQALVRILDKGRDSVSFEDLEAFRSASEAVASKCVIIPEYMDMARAAVEKLTCRAPPSAPSAAPALLSLLHHAHHYLAHYCDEVAARLDGREMDVRWAGSGGLDTTALLRRWAAMLDLAEDYTAALSLCVSSGGRGVGEVSQLNRALKALLEAAGRDTAVLSLEALNAFCPENRDKLQGVLLKMTTVLNKLRGYRNLAITC